MNRFGRFFISRRIIEDFPERVIQMFHNLQIIVVRAEMDYARNGIEYVGMGECFDSNDPNMMVPRYDILGIIDVEANPRFEVRRVDNA